jgi:hypothetical protein
MRMRMKGMNSDKHETHIEWQEIRIPANSANIHDPEETGFDISVLINSLANDALNIYNYAYIYHQIIEWSEENELWKIKKKSVAWSEVLSEGLFRRAKDTKGKFKRVYRVLEDIRTRVTD